MPSASSSSAPLVSAAGEVLAGLTRAIAAVRPADKPLHPRGDVRRGVLVRHGLEEPLGVPWLDEPGTDDVLVRWSRAVGLPSPCPDVHGLAVRLVPLDAPPSDLLLATTGWTPPGRFLLRPGLTSQRPMTSLLPYATPQGPVLLGARPRGGAASLYVASPWGRWRPFADLRELSGSDLDLHLDFDPVQRPLPDLAFPEWVRRLREPAYRSARRSRADERRLRTPGRSGPIAAARPR